MKKVNKMVFKVFDGATVKKVDSDGLVDFIKNCTSAVTVSPIKDYSRVNYNRIKIPTSRKTWIIKTNVKAKNCVVNQRRVAAISKNHKRRVFSTIAECSRVLKIDDSNISKVIKGKRKTASGYRFELI